MEASIGGAVFRESLSFFLKILSPGIFGILEKSNKSNIKARRISRDLVV